MMNIKTGGMLGIFALLSTAVCAESATMKLDDAPVNNEMQDNVQLESIRYAGAGVSFFDSNDFNLPVFDVRYGQQLTDVFAAEARVGFGLSDDRKGVTEVKENYFLGVYGRANYPISEKLSAYAFAGLAFVDYRLSLVNGGKDSDSQFDFSGGFGGSYTVSDKVSLGLEFWIQDIKDTSGFSLNAAYKL